MAISSLSFWLSGSLILDLVIMPTLWTTGMMESSGFASASYSIFWIFNRVELVCAAVALSSIWAWSQESPSNAQNKQQLFAGAVMLLAIALSDTFILTPYLSGLGINQPSAQPRSRTVLPLRLITASTLDRSVTSRRLSICC